MLIHIYSFITVLSAYAVFVGPMTGLLCVHYWIIQKRRFHVPDLYVGSKQSAYWYSYGINWRTCVAWVCAVVPRYVTCTAATVVYILLIIYSMPGFVNNANSKLKVGVGATDLYSLSYILGFFLAAFISWALHTIFPYDYQETTELERQAMLIDGISNNSHFRDDLDGDSKEVVSATVEIPKNKSA
jgi:NCS1 family nucleobase:cation symporter-1